MQAGRPSNDPDSVAETLGHASIDVQLESCVFRVRQATFGKLLWRQSRVLIR